jgi:hypothetical protein
MLYPTCPILLFGSEPEVMIEDTLTNPWLTKCRSVLADRDRLFDKVELVGVSSHLRRIAICYTMDNRICCLTRGAHGS